MGILPIVPLPKHQIIIFTHEAIRKKVRGQLGEMEKVTPTDPMPMGAVRKRRKSMRELFAQPTDLFIQTKCQSGMGSLEWCIVTCVK